MNTYIIKVDTGNLDEEGNFEEVFLGIYMEKDIESIKQMILKEREGIDSIFSDFNMFEVYEIKNAITLTFEGNKITECFKLHTQR